MTRAELEHAIRAPVMSQAITRSTSLALGSQAILGQYPDAPESLRQSAEADIAPVKAIDMLDVIDGNLGELSIFHRTFGFYVHGVSIEAAVLPSGWQKRAIEVCNENTRNNTGWCAEAHDLAASKLVAFRDKDRDFVRTLIVEKLIAPAKLCRLLDQLSNNPRVTSELLAVIQAWVGGVLKDMSSWA